MQIIGHRGARNEAPENTEAGFQHIRDMGLHHVELDVRLSADGQLVVIHDTSVDRTCNGRGKVNEMTSTQLQQLDATGPFPDWPVSSPVPLLCDVLTQWPQLQSIQLEVKTTDLPSLDLIARKLLDLIEQFNLWQIATITSADQRLLHLVNSLAPHVSRGFVAERFVRSPFKICLNHRCNLLVVNYHRCSPKLIRSAHLLGLEVSVWTVNSLNWAQRLYDWGADSLITDVPGLMLNHFPLSDIELIG